MARSKQDIRRFIKLNSICSLLVLIFLILNLYIIFSLIVVNKKINLEINYFEDLLAFTEANYDKKELELFLLEESINNIKNIENKISEIKHTYFNNAYLYEQKVIEGTGKKKIVYLTIDDGPSAYTNSFLNVLEKYDVLATFFLIGNTSKQYINIYDKISKNGHTIGNHTYTHRIVNGVYRSSNIFIEDMLKQEEFIFEKTGLKTDILRFPGGSKTAGSRKKPIIEKLKQLNYGYIDWNVAAGDANGVDISKEGIYRYVINGTKRRDIAVVLMHDFNKNSLYALPSIIEELKENDYIFLPLFYESSKVIK
ncbi:MAG: polysaccharide deacetylase [Bacilli bacterium]|nr:polysaccharide deacetylase [Bacilli bacterium]